MFEQLLEAIARGLERLGIPYMLIGGQAVLLYGEPRLTRDIDVTLGAGLERLSEVLEWVRGSGWQVLVEAPAEFVGKTMVLPCLERGSGIRIDLIFSFSPYEQQALKRARHVPVGGVRVSFASLEDLIIHKVLAGRPRDLEDLRGVLLKNQAIDLEYVHHWLSEFDRDLGEKSLERFEQVRQALASPSDGPSPS
jgi:predicted nucleotidyltransferase